MRRVIVAAVVFKDEILLVRKNGRFRKKEIWLLPGGQLEGGEPYLLRLYQELREETSLRIRGWVKFLAELKDKTPFSGEEVSIRVYLVHGVSGQLQAGSDVIDARWVKKKNLGQCELTQSTRNAIEKLEQEGYF